MPSFWDLSMFSGSIWRIIFFQSTSKLSFAPRGRKERERVGGVQPRRDDLSRYRLRQANCRANLSSLLPLGQVGTKKVGPIPSPESPRTQQQELTSAGEEEYRNLLLVFSYPLCGLFFIPRGEEKGGSTQESFCVPPKKHTTGKLAIF